MDLSPCLSIALRGGGGTAALRGSGPCAQRQHGGCGKKHGLHQNPPEAGQAAVRWNLSNRLDVLGFKHYQIVAAMHTAPDTPADPTARPGQGRGRRWGT